MSLVRLLPIAEPICQRDIVLKLHNRVQKQEEVANFFEFLCTYFRNLKK